MHAVDSVMSNTRVPRADIVPGHDHGTTCAPGFTAFVRDTLAGFAHDMKINHLFKESSQGLGARAQALAPSRTPSLP